MNDFLGRANKSTPSAILIGDESLATVCGDYLLTQNWRLLVVVSADRKIQQWAAKANIPTAMSIASLDWQALSYDYLFSVTNFSILPDAMIQAAQKGAFNFHDGPLPEMGGLNTPSWAILNGASTHAVSWHKLSQGVDTGEVCVRKDIAIEPDDTIFELNARCFEYGFETFRELVDQIEDHQGPSRVETPVSSYYARDRKPVLLGYIHGEQTGAEVQRLLRALSTNGFRNALGSAKVAIDGRSYIVGKAEVVQGNADPSAPWVPGAYYRDGQHLCVKLADACLLRIETLLQLSGATTPISNIAPEGQILQPAIETLATTEGFPELNESQWISGFRNFQSIQATLKPNDRQAQKRIVTLLAPDHRPSERFIAAAALIAARLSGTDAADLVITTPDSKDWHAKSLGYFSNSLPARVALKDSAERCTQALATTLKRYATNPTPSNDLAYRFPGSTNQIKALTQTDLPIELIPSRAMIEESYQSVGAGLYFCLDSGEVVYAGAISVEHERNLQRYFKLADSYLNDPQADLLSFELFDASDLALYQQANRPIVEPESFSDITQEIDAAAQLHGARIAISHGGQHISFSELSTRSSQLAQQLRNDGLGDGKLIGVLIHRSVDAVIAMLAIMKSGSAYVPLDPDYPFERLKIICEQSKITHAFASSKTQQSHQDLPLEFLRIQGPATATDSASLPASIQASDLAYVIYTSGSTGVPKGVMVEHGNVTNFLSGIDERVAVEQNRDGKAQPGEFLSVTSISFDISVLELWWSLSRGLKVILFDENIQSDRGTTPNTRAFEFSLYYWNAQSLESRNTQDTYKLLLDGAKYADENGFAAIWTPERHFGDFGGAYPNPAVTGAAVASVTNNLAIRAGSCVAPLHHPIRIAEEWSVVDNLCGGRAGISFASGWMPNDFVLAPENFENVKEVLADNIEKVRSLWRGDRLTFDGPKGQPVEVTSMPRPIQKELPVWLTSAGNIETFQQAGKSGYYLLTHLLGQSIDELGDKILAYREAWKSAGHSGNPHVTLMLHTFVADTTEQAIEISREPMKAFLHTSLNLVKAAAWDFPTYQTFSEDGKRSVDEFFDQLAPEDLDDLLEFSFQRYAKDSGLIGSLEDCEKTLNRISKIEVDELACLVDFGIEADIVLDSLPKLNALRSANQQQEEKQVDLQTLCANHNISHLQCTPSQASIFLLDPNVDALFGKLDYLLVGGEAINQDLANTLCEKTKGQVINMYGPTETTVWSTVQKLANGKPVTIGQPLKNQSIAVVDDGLRRVPAGTIGELLIGGLGVTRGYYGRDDLTAERFIQLQGERFYRTGDLVRLERNGELGYIGRNDHQVKVRGYRIELREIENHLSTKANIQQVAVHTEDDRWGGTVLVAYLVSGDKIDSGELRQYCKSKLPDFMVPNRFVMLDQLPLTPNGKTDYNALKDQTAVKLNTSTSASSSVGAPASSSSEKDLLAIWSELLELEVKDTGANFFDLGGHSILAVRMQGEMERVFGRRFAISDIFRYPTIRAFAGYIDAGATPSTTGVKDGSKRAKLRKRLRQRKA